MFNYNDNSSNEPNFLGWDWQADSPFNDFEYFFLSPIPQDKISSPEMIPQTLLKRKRSNKSEENISENNNNNFIYNNASIQAIISNKNLNYTKKNEQCIPYNINNIENENHLSKLIINKENKNQKNNSSTQNCTNNKIQKEEEKINSKRSVQKDNFSIKLFKEVNNWIIRNIKKTHDIKIYRPNYDIFTHNTNIIDIYFFLGIQYKNIFCMTPKIKKALDQLLIELKIKKEFKKIKTRITEKSKEYNNVLKLLKIYNYINENDKLNIDEVNRLIINLLKNEGFKEPNDNDFYKKDKDNINQLLIINKIKESYDYQNKCRKNIVDKEIEELNMTFREAIIAFYQTGFEFEKFSKKIYKIVENFKLQKNSEYSLLDNFPKYNGFIRMIEQDCGLNSLQKDKIRELTNYFRNRILNEEELLKYRENFLHKKV